MKKLTTALLLITMLFVVVFNTIRVEAQIEPPDRSFVPTQTPTAHKILVRPQETREAQEENGKKHKPTATRIAPTPTEIAPPADTPSVFLLPLMKEKTKEEMYESRPHTFGD